MSKRILVLLTLFLLIVLAACNPTPEPTPTDQPPTPTPVSEPTPLPEPSPTPEPTALPFAAEGVVISEVLAGVAGNNNYEFIELYNAGDAPIDLDGWSLWYRLGSSEEDLLVKLWRGRTLIPAQGHYLLGRAGQDLGITADATFEQALNTFNGGLELRAPGLGVVDRLAWGKGPEVFTEGNPAPKLENGQSLERLPGGAAGNAIDSDDNAADFQLNDAPQPQNSGSAATPLVERRLLVEIEAPESVGPGSQFEYRLTVGNETGQDAQNVVITLPLPTHLATTELPDGVSLEDGVLTWLAGDLADGESAEVIVPITAPWTYLTAVVHSYTAAADNWPQVAVGGPAVTRIEGGVIPIATARELQGQELTVEGVATMYTGGYYAGGGNTKFYVQDDSGGMQVQVFGGDGVVNIAIGDQVRVHGTIGAYRGAKQIVPVLVPDDVEILAKASPETIPEPLPVTVAQASSDKTTLPGMLVQAEGAVTRAEEFTYSYEIDLSDEDGNTLELYVDKQTNINIESIETGKLYGMKGILEVRDGKSQLYPRLQSDLEEVFPPVLLVTATAPNTVLPGEVMTYTATIFNHTDAPMTAVRVEAELPAASTALDAISEGGERQGDVIVWTLEELPGEGGQASVWYAVGVADAASGAITAGGFSATAEQWPEPAASPELRTFVGRTVPIWAIQGEGASSPYVLDRLKTAGVVTGVFPDLGGFFIQDLESDDDPNTSEGLFINTAELTEFPQVGPGDEVEITGQVRETGQQTQLLVEDAADIVLLYEEQTQPPAIDLDPPTTTAEAEVYFETLEGMLVQVPGPAIAVSPTSKYGEYVLVLPEHGVDRLYQGEDNGFMIMVDDGATTTHADRSTLPYVISTGDEISDLVGPLAYTYGRYKIEPVTMPEIAQQTASLPALPPTNPDEFSVMTWNVENLFDARDPNPADPPKPTPAQYELALDKVANTIVSAGVPSVIGLQEVENIGVLEDIAANPVLQTYDYQPALIEGHDSRGIDVGYLVRGDQVTLLDTRQFDAPEGLTSRPPLLIQVEWASDGGTETVYLLNNHFSSMSGGVEATEPRRTAQAAWNVQVMEEQILADDPDAKVVVMGDLNSFYDSLPIDTLRQAGLIPVLDTVPDDQRYNYIFQGESQVLDHILVTPSLFDAIERVEILHVNADYPPPIPDDPSPLRKSDHDPIIAVFTFGEK